MRVAWAGLGDLLINEGDVVAPPGMIAEMLACPEPWCTAPCWVGVRSLDDTTGLVKWSRSIQRAWPDYPEAALCREMFKGSRHDRGLGWGEPSRYLGEVPIDPSVLRVWPELAERSAAMAMRPGTTIHPLAIDMAMGRQFRINGITPHLHQPELWHLHYGNHVPDWVEGVYGPDWLGERPAIGDLQAMGGEFPWVQELRRRGERRGGAYPSR